MKKSTEDLSLTHQWIAQNWVEVSPKISNFLSRKLPQSQSMDLIEEHLSTFAESLLRNRALDSHLEAGKPVYLSNLKRWAYRKALNEIKKWGKDASLREIRGATTTANRWGYATVEAGDVLAIGDGHKRNGAVAYAAGKRFLPLSASLPCPLECVPSPSENEGQILLQERLEQIKSLIQSRDWDSSVLPTAESTETNPLWHVFSGLLLGYTVPELAEDLGRHQKEIIKMKKYLKRMLKKIEIEPEKIEPEKIEPEKIEPEKIEPEKIEPEKIEPEKIEESFNLRMIKKLEEALNQTLTSLGETEKEMSRLQQEESRLNLLIKEEESK